MNFLMYIILGVIFVICLVFVILDDNNPSFSFHVPSGVSTLVSSIFVVDIICIVILALFSIEITPYMIKRDNIKNINRYESIIYELEHPENYREIDIIHDVREWNDDYNVYVYAHDNNIFWGILYPVKDLEGTYYIDINDYLERPKYE